jgi:hypothetical protein
MLHIPVHNVLCMQVFEPAGHLGGIEHGAGLLKARLAHVVDVELEVAPVHDGQHQTQSLLRLKRVRQAHLEGGDERWRMNG